MPVDKNRAGSVRCVYAWKGLTYIIYIIRPYGGVFLNQLSGFPSSSPRRSNYIPLSLRCTRAFFYLTAQCVHALLKSFDRINQSCFSRCIRIL